MFSFVLRYNSFAELYNNFDKVSLGYKEDELASPDDMELYYSKEEQEKYGVLGIEIKLVNDRNKKEIIINEDKSIPKILLDFYYTSLYQKIAVFNIS